MRKSVFLCYKVIRKRIEHSKKLIQKTGRGNCRATGTGHAPQQSLYIARGSLAHSFAPLNFFWSSSFSALFSSSSSPCTLQTSVFPLIFLFCSTRLQMNMNLNMNEYLLFELHEYHLFKKSTVTDLQLPPFWWLDYSVLFLVSPEWKACQVVFWQLGQSIMTEHCVGHPINAVFLTFPQGEPDLITQRC